MSIETHTCYTFATLLDPIYKAAGFTCREKSQAAKEFLISKLEEGFHQRRSTTHISTDSNINHVGSSDTDDSVREIDEEAATWNQLQRSSSDGPGLLNNVIRNLVTRYVKDKLGPKRWDPLEFWNKKPFSLPPPWSAPSLVAN